FRVIAAVEREVGAAAADLGDHAGIVAVYGIDPFNHGDVHACFLELNANRCGDALPVGLPVVQYGDGLRLDGLDDEFGRGGALLIVAPDGAADHFIVLAVGHRRGGGRGRDHQHAFAVVNVGGGNGGT